jgi:hypothetical protein
MPTSPISGKDGKVQYGSGPTTLAITKWSLKMSNDVQDVHNTTDGIRRIPGLSDAEGDVEGHVDTAADLSATLSDGDIVTLKLFTDGTKFYQLSAIIEDLEFSSEVEGTYDFSFSYKLASGSVTVPV